MRTVKITVNHDGYNKVNHKRTFEILDEIDAMYLKDDIDGCTVEEIIPDIVARNESELYYTHKFYRIEDLEGFNRYVAVPHFLKYYVHKYPANIHVFCEAFEDEDSSGFDIDMDSVNALDEDWEKMEYIEDMVYGYVGFTGEMCDWISEECKDVAGL